MSLRFLNPVFTDKILQIDKKYFYNLKQIFVSQWNAYALRKNNAKIMKRKYYIEKTKEKHGRINMSR